MTSQGWQTVIAKYTPQGRGSRQVKVPHGPANIRSEVSRTNCVQIASPHSPADQQITEGKSQLQPSRSLTYEPTFSGDNVTQLSNGTPQGAP